ncbi:MAG TPA: DUF499 domain-containing protein, partial [Ktedonobacteraceae bacterium]|nr:DUF499 domain-containing protein [Ktedonobacteraceae bacterium]
MWQLWTPIFGKTLGFAERSLVSELRETRNRWAHENGFDYDATYRALDSTRLLLKAISAEQAEEVNDLREEVMRQRYDDQTRKQAKRPSGPLYNGSTGLRPWREIIVPQQDVASGKYEMAEFAADLGQVHRGKGADEYRLPRDFFQRTYLTSGLGRLLSDALLRLNGDGGSPVVDLQTNFGGGKTHSLLALYHLFSGTPYAELGKAVEALVLNTGIEPPANVRRAVLVGVDLAPATPRLKSDGMATRTLWGELAHQLLGAEGYALVANDDLHGTNPGKDTLAELFTRAAPCLVLIDEWVAFARQLYTNSNLQAGSFDANMSFAQSLTQAAMVAPRTQLVVTIPASDGDRSDERTSELGGEGGQVAASTLRQIVGRVETPWRPADANEGFEIVRRRIFQEIAGSDLYTARDAVARSFAKFYQEHRAEFPPAASQNDYEERIKRAYPIHPELFDRLYNDWSTLERFQRTRGVLRLVARIVQTL